MPHPKEESDKFRYVIENAKTGIFFTVCSNNGLAGRPMHTMLVDNDCSLWFFTHEFNNHVQQIWRNNEVYINYGNECLQVCASVKGKAYLTRDINKINELYTPFIREWLPRGINDPGLLLIRVEPVNVEYSNADGDRDPSSFNISVTSRLKIKGTEFNYG